MAIDPRTLIVTSALASLLFAAMLTLELRRERRSRWIALWSGALSASAVANLAYALVGVLPLNTTLRVGYLFATAAFAMMLTALRLFDGAVPRARAIGAIALALAAIHGAMLLAHAPERGLIIYTSISFGAWLVLCAFAAGGAPRRERTGARLVMASAFGMWAAVFFVRAAVAATGGSSLLLGADVTQIGFLLVQFSALLVTSLDFLVMSKQRSDAAILRLASTDDLTGLLNRRRFMEVAAAESVRVERDGAPLSALMIDIDHFKYVNDAHGHRAGDFVLRVFGQILAEGLRTYDVACRFGGEEFAVLLPGADLDGAIANAERLRARVEATRIEFEGASLGVCVSIGVAESAPAFDDVEKLLARADAALYQAKSNGRNCVVAAPSVVVAAAGEDSAGKG